MVFPHFTPDSAAILRESLLSGGSLPSATVKRLLDQTGYSIQQLMIALLPLGAQYARAPISNFQVGAVALAHKDAHGPGNLYFGANMEFNIQPLSTTIHGEQSVVNHALLSGETELKAIAVTAPPCGHCRQFLYEIPCDNHDLNIILPMDADENYLSYISQPLRHYLPHAFGPADLNSSTRLMQPQNHKLTINSDDPLVLAALGAANASYAPYSKEYAGVALQSADQRIFTGRLIESAAFNPTLPPLQSALAYMNLCNAPGSDYHISAAALVETSHASITHYDSTASLLRKIAPRVDLIYHITS